MHVYSASAARPAELNPFAAPPPPTKALQARQSGRLPGPVRARNLRPAAVGPTMRHNRDLAHGGLSVFLGWPGLFARSLRPSTAATGTLSCIGCTMREARNAREARRGFRPNVARGDAVATTTGAGAPGLPERERTLEPERTPCMVVAPKRRLDAVVKQGARVAIEDATTRPSTNWVS
jgi:hypothetical protein